MEVQIFQNLITVSSKMFKDKILKWNHHNTMHIQTATIVIELMMTHVTVFINKDAYLAPVFYIWVRWKEGRYSPVLTSPLPTRQTFSLPVNRSTIVGKLSRSVHFDLLFCVLGMPTASGKDAWFPRWQLVANCIDHTLGLTLWITMKLNK